ncbi:MAG: hypothetical protein M3O01_04090 [Pseudomonadota bacterium]|nr:hypothetical protein [Pseudomonadota bacterium]
MLQNNAKVEVAVEDVIEAVPGGTSHHPSVVLETEAMVNGELRDTSIEVRDTDAPAFAAALLNAELDSQPSDTDLPVAVRCLAAGIVHAASDGHVRMHLQFESGQVLPIEMPRAAAAALARALVEHTPETQDARH